MNLMYIIKNKRFKKFVFSDSVKEIAMLKPLFVNWGMFLETL